MRFTRVYYKIAGCGMMIGALVAEQFRLFSEYNLIFAEYNFNKRIYK